MTYGERFRELRELAGLKQIDVGLRLFKKSRKNPQAGIAGIESTAGRIPRPAVIRAHAAALGCSVSDLVGPVTDLWIDRARRGEFDAIERRAGPASDALERHRVRRVRTGSR